MNQPLPAHIDHLSILADLRDWGWLDSKIETVCGFSNGYVARLRCKDVTAMSYFRAARLYNFWLDQAPDVSRGTIPPNRTLAVTT